METDAPILELPDWLILDALSDDYESVEQIIQLVHHDWPSAAPLEVIARLENLHSAGHVFLTLDAVFDRAAMVREIGETHDRRFWFGRTLSGTALRQQHAAHFGHP